MTPKQFLKFRQRDMNRCPHCGEDERLVPHHRLNRGMGGSKERDLPANILTFCAEGNLLMESNAWFAMECIDKGWKLKSGDVPSEKPFFDECDGFWYLLDNDFGRVRQG